MSDIKKKGIKSKSQFERQSYASEVFIVGYLF